MAATLLLPHGLLDRAATELDAIAAEREALEDDLRRPLPFALGGMARRLLWLIARRSPAAVSTESIWHALYGSRPDCEQPDGATKCIHVFMTQIRAALPAGVVIETLRGVGYRMPIESRAVFFQLAGVTE